MAEETKKRSVLRYLNVQVCPAGWNVVFTCTHGSIHFVPVAQWCTTQFIEENDKGEFPEENASYSTDPMVAEEGSVGLVPLCAHSQADWVLGIAGPGEERNEDRWSGLAKEKVDSFRRSTKSTPPPVCN